MPHDVLRLYQNLANSPGEKRKSLQEVINEEKGKE